MPDDSAQGRDASQDVASMTSGHTDDEFVDARSTFSDQSSQSRMTEAVTPRGEHKDHVMLHKVRSLEPPEGTPSKDLERINRLLEMGGRLLEKHAQQFDIRDFYTTHDAEEGVCQICDELKEIVEGWHMPDAVTIDDAVPKDWVEEDMQLLRKLLEFVLNGVDCDVDDKVRQLWIDAKANHIDKLNCVEVVDPNDLELGVRRAQGAKGAVFEATWRGRLVAVKRPLWEDDMPLEELAEFVREVSWHALLHSHPNIVQLLATTTGGYLVMELADSDLYSLCHGHVKLEFSVNLRLLQQAAAGLNCMHLRNLVHGDVKSRNCLIFTDEQGNPHLKLADLGMTFRVGESRSKTIRKGGGTAAWIAPEVYHSKPIDKASDVYSLGVVMFEVVTGKEPYDAGKQTEFAIMGQKLSGKGPCAVRPQDCPKEMLDLMRRCCAVDPAHRPKMEEVVESLQRMPVDWNESCALKVPPEVSTGSSAADSWVESAANVLTSLSTSSNPSQTTTHLSHTISVRSLPSSPHSADTGSGSFGVERTLSGSDVADRLGTKVLALDGELGLVIDCQLAREGSQVVFKLQLANETKRTVEGVKVVMSANSFGLQPANKEISLPVIPPSSVQTTTNLLVHDRKMLSSGPASDELQVVVETPKSWLVCFTETIHIELLFCEADKIEEEEFRSQWQELGKEREKAEVIPVMVPIGKSVLGTFEAANIGVVVYGRMPGSDWEAMYLRCVLDSLPAQVLLQLYFRRGIEHVDCACRSDKPDLLPMVINAVRRILSSMRELDCAAGAGTSDVDTVDDAVGPSSPDPPARPQDIFNGSLGTPGPSQELKTKASKQAILDSGGHTHVGDNERELWPAKPEEKDQIVQDLEDEFRRVLERAAAEGLAEKVDTLLGCAEDSKNSWFCRTAWMLAASNGHEAVAAVLLRRGANINEKDTDGNTALHLAAREGRMAMVKFLLSHRANKNIRNENGIFWGDTAADVARKEGRPEIARVIKTWGKKWKLTQYTYKSRR